MSRIRLLMLLLLASAVWIGCSSSSTPPVDLSLVRPVDGVEIDPTSQPSDEQKAAMLEAKDALFATLSDRLLAAMGSGGPGTAIAVCQNEAPKIAQQISETHNLKIGRVGVRLRNPDNKAPAWAGEWIDAKTSEPQFAMLNNGAAAALLPIKLQAQCLVCHGPVEQILPEVKTQLASRYPADQATGFSEGELRGWFWIETKHDDPAP